MSQTPRTSASAFSMFPAWAIALFYAAVFMIFAPVSLLLASSFAQQRPLGALAFMALLSGGVAVSWAATFTSSRKFAVGIVAFTAGIMVFSGPLRRTPVGLHDGALSVEGVGTVVAIVAGYVLFVVFIAGQGRATLRLQTEMALAAQIHETLVPPIERMLGRLEILGDSRASSEMGGDLVDVVEHGGGADVYLADVSGHGVRAGVVMGMVKSSIRTRLLGGGPLAGVIEDLNTVLHQTTSSGMFVTFACLRVPSGLPSGGDARLEYALAGHHPILVHRAAAGRVEPLDNEHLPLGVSPEERYATRAVDVAAGDLLVLYTDGLSECADQSGRLLGHDALRRLIETHAGEPLAAIRDAIFAAVRAHGTQGDDETLLLVRVAAPDRASDRPS